MEATTTPAPASAEARLTMTEAAVRAGRCESTIRVWIRSKKLPAIKSTLTGRVVIRASDLDALLAADPTAPATG